MIIVGYQGVGKSTLSGNNSNYIDLESGNFWVDGERVGCWYKIYANIAKHLSEQGFNVFTASHKIFREQLSGYQGEKVIVYPSLELKEQWIDRLQKRYEESGKEKDYKALMNAKEMYDENISDLMSESEFKHIVIKSIPYDLKDLIES